MAADLTCAVEEWLAYKATVSRDQFGNSHEARVDDIIRLARALRAVRGEQLAQNTGHLGGELAGLSTAELDYDHLLRAFADLRSRYEPATLARTLSTLRGFSRWALRRGLVDHDPTDEISVPNRFDAGADGVVSHAFTALEVEALLDAARTPSPTARSAWDLRDEAVIRLAADCGPRASEICALQVRHLDRRFEHPILRLTVGTKGAKPRDVPVPRPTLRALESYLVDRTRRLGPPAHNDRLFVRVAGSPFDRSFLDRLIRRLAESAGIAVPEQAAAHALRHHYGVQLALRGVQVPVIQALLGHADSRTTAVYTKIASMQLIAALDDAGWLDRATPPAVAQ